MNNRIVLVTGAGRSGKSRYAECRARALGERRLYVATAEPGDPEMESRIAAHRRSRGSDWITVEEPLDPATALLSRRGAVDCAIVDCVTLWLSNLLLASDTGMLEERIETLVQTLSRLDFHVVLVTNEVGWGIVPEHPLARRFRDLAGWTNQRLAARADEVVLMVAGIPVPVKT